jgi:hypothetical protein
MAERIIRFKEYNDIMIAFRDLSTYLERIQNEDISRRSYGFTLYFKIFVSLA